MIINIAQQVKHRLVYAPRDIRRITDDLNTNISPVYAKLFPLKYVKKNRIKNIGITNYPRVSTLHLDSTLLIRPSEKSIDLKPVPKIIFLLWTGDNPMPRRRVEAIQQITEQNPEFKIELISKENLADWIVDKYPLNPLYECLSYTHRSDYLRAYLMHHHGGVYMDIKKIDSSWSGIVEKLNQSQDLWVAGPHEVSGQTLATVTHSFAGNLIDRKMRMNYSNSLNQFAFACKPGSPFTGEWLKEVERRLAYLETDLQEHPAHDAIGNFPEYPVPWNFLLGQFFSHITLFYSNHIDVSDII